MSLRTILTPPVIIAVILTALTFGGCKTTEKNYRQAYERAVNAADSTRLDFDQTIYGRYRRQMKARPMVVAGDTLDIRYQQIALTKECGGLRENIRAYNLVAGEFKQLFNARSMCERLRTMGYPGAFVVNTAEPYYFVITRGYDTLDQVRRAFHDLQDNPPFKLRQGLPFILTNTFR